jgi:hypothetical protein
MLIWFDSTVKRPSFKTISARTNGVLHMHSSKAGDQVLLLPTANDPKLALKKVPFHVVDYNKENGTLRIQRGHYIEPVNIRLVRPYFGTGGE